MGELLFEDKVGSPAHLLTNRAACDHILDHIEGDTMPRELEVQVVVGSLCSMVPGAIAVNTIESALSLVWIKGEQRRTGRANEGVVS